MCFQNTKYIGHHSIAALVFAVEMAVIGKDRCLLKITY
jgi:hypothetical protein